jgi:hypothetical protein
LNFLATNKHKGHKEIFSAIIGPPSLKLWRGWLWKNFAGRRCEKKALLQRFPARNPTAYTALAVCCAAAQFFKATH